MKTSIDAPEFWIKQWKASLEKNPLRANSYRSAKMWDRQAENYKKNENGDEESKKGEKNLIEQLVKKEIITPGIRILDVGCGPGNFAIPFAALGARVLAVDISPKMINRLEQETPPDLKSLISTRVGDWRDLDLKNEQLYRQFDLVFAHMTPAVNTPQHFLKLNDASRAWCLNATWIGKRTSKPLDEIAGIIYGERKVHGSRYMVYALNLLISLGFYPQTDFYKTSWQKKEALADVIEYYTRYFTDDPRYDNPETRLTIANFLKNKAIKGFVDKYNAGTIGRMLWHI